MSAGPSASCYHWSPARRRASDVTHWVSVLASNRSMCPWQIHFPDIFVCCFFFFSLTANKKAEGKCWVIGILTLGDIFSCIGFSVEHFSAQIQFEFVWTLF